MYVGNTMHATLHICCQIQWTQSSLSYAKSRPSQIQRIFSFVYSVLCIQTDVSPHLLLMCRQFDTRYTPHLLPNTAHISGLALCQLWPVSNLRNCSFANSCINIQINVSTILLQICRQFDSGYTAHLLPIQCTSFDLNYVISDHRQIQRNCSFSYTLLYIQIHASPLLLEMCQQYDLPCVPHFLQIKPISSN